MFDSLLIKGCQPIGLDIGTDSIKMFQLQRVGSIVRVRACAKIKLPQTSPDQQQDSPDQLAPVIADALKEGGFRGRRVISSLSCRQLKVKNIRLPVMPPEELNEAIRWEAKERLGFDMEPDQLNYIRAGQIRLDDETHEEVIILAVTPETIEEHVSLLDSAGLHPVNIDAAPVAVFRGFERFLRRKADEQTVSVILDIGHEGTRVIVARGRRIVFIKNIDIGGRKINDAVAGRLNITPSEAMEVRLRFSRKVTADDREFKPSDHCGTGIPDDSKFSGAPDMEGADWSIYEAIRGQVETLAQEISLHLRYCAVTFRGLRAKKIIVTGGQAYDSILLKMLADNIGLPCRIGNPLRGIDVSGVDLGADRRGMLAEWSVCAGLAMRGMDFQAGSRSHQTDKDNADEHHRLSA